MIYQFIQLHQKHELNIHVVQVQTTARPQLPMVIGTEARTMTLGDYLANSASKKVMIYSLVIFKVKCPGQFRITVSFR